MYRVRLSRVLQRLLFLSILIAQSHPGVAQTVFNPRLVEFTPSPDDGAAGPDAPAVVTDYSLKIYIAGQSTAFRSMSLGKPVVDADGKIRVDLLSFTAQFATPGVTYEARVLASSPGGAALSGVSNPFTYSASCNPVTVSKTAVNAAPDGATTSVQVTADAGCEWNAFSSAEWVSVSPSSGAGTGTLAVAVARTDTSETRTATIIVGGSVLTITQAGLACTVSVSSNSVILGADGTGQVRVVAPQGCNWSSSSSAPWLSVGAGGTGAGTLNMQSSANPTVSPRTAVLSVAGQTLSVTQPGASCTPTIGFPTLLLPARSTLTGANAYTWSASTDDPRALQRPNGGRVMAAWYGPAFSIDIAIADGMSQQVALYMVDYDSPSRIQTVEAVDETGRILDSRTVSNFSNGSYLVWTLTGHVRLRVTSIGGVNAVVSGVLMGTPSTAGPAGASAAFLRTDSTTKGNWIGTYGSSGYAIAADVTTEWYAASGSTGVVSVSLPSGCAWTASSDRAWLKVESGASGDGNGTVGVNLAPNTSGDLRSATLTIGGQVLSITQAAGEAPVCGVTLNATVVDIAARGGSAVVGVTSSADCHWNALSQGSWLTATPGSGVGAGTVVLSAAPNPANVQRSALVTVADKAVTVTQAASACTVTLSPGSGVLDAAGGQASVTVSAGAGCQWAASSSTSWLTVTSGASGSGSGTVAVSASSNPATSVRSATITVADQTFTVTQAGATCNIVIAPAALPTLATATITGASTWTWQSATAEPRGLERATSGRVTAAWYADAFTIDVNVAAGRVQQLAVYALDYETDGRAQRYDLVDASGVTLDTRTLTDFSGGKYAVWAVTGHVTLRITRTAGTNAVVSGVFFGEAQAGAPVNGTSATFSKTDDTTAGNWKGVYGANGYVIASDSAAQFLDPRGGSGSVAVTAGSTCAWTAASDAAWVTFTNASGTGSGTAAFGVAKTTSTTARPATVTIGGQTLTLTQAPQTVPACDFTLSTTTQSVPAGGLSSTVTVTASGGCAWTAASNAAWLTVTSGASGTGTGTAAVSAAANTSPSPRVGTVTIAGQTLTVTQAAAPCSYLLSTTTQTFPAAAGTGALTVTAASGCAWTATSSAAWLTVTAGATASGTAAVSYSVAANPTSTARTATLTIAGQTVTVTQAGVPCAYTISASVQSLTAPAATGSVTVTTPAGCAWTAASSASWLTVTSGASGTGNGTVAFAATANTTATPRTATLTIAGQTFTVNQAGVPCTYTISASSQAIATAGGTGTVTVTAPSACAWTSSSSASWATITSGGSGNGTSTLTFSVTANTGSTARTAVLTIAGQTFTITQANTTCTFSLSATSTSLAAAAGTGTLTVTAPAGCAWTSSSSATWLTVTSGGSGNGTGTLAFAATANTAATPRTATLTIAGQVFAVTQAGTTCTITLAATTQSFPSAAGTGTVAVSAASGCAWSTTTNASWLTVTSGGSGTGPGTVAFSVADNTTTAARYAALTIGGQTFTVTQAATTQCTVTVDPGSRSYTKSKTSGSVAVGNSSSCSWTAVSSAAWLTVTSAKVAQGTVAYSVAANNTGGVRSATIAIGSATFTVTQTNNNSPNVVTGLHVVEEGKE